MSPIIKQSYYITFYTHNNNYTHTLTCSPMTVKAQTRKKTPLLVLGYDNIYLIRCNDPEIAGNITTFINPLVTTLIQ